MKLAAPTATAPLGLSVAALLCHLNLLRQTIFATCCHTASHGATSCR